MKKINKYISMVALSALAMAMFHKRLNLLPVKRKKP